MPPKASSATKPKTTQGPTKDELSAINAYLAQKPDFDKLVKDARANTEPATRIEESDYDKALKEGVKAAIRDTRQQAETKVNMPVHPKEEEAGSSMYHH